MCMMPKAPKTPAPVALPPAVAPIETATLAAPIANAPPPPAAETAKYFGTAQSSKSPVSASLTDQAGFESLRIKRNTTGTGLNIL